MPILDTQRARLHRGVLTAVLCALLAAGGAAHAQQAPSQSEQTVDPQAMERAQQAHLRMQEIQMELGRIQQDTLENEPQLIEQIEALEKRAIATMEEQGHDPEGTIARLEQLQGEFETAETPEKQQEVAIAFQEEQMNLYEAQQALMQDESFLAAQQEVQDNMLDAMRKRHPQTDDLITEIETIQQEMMTIQPQPQAEPLR